MDTVSNIYELNDIEQYYDGRRVLNIEKLTLQENQIIGFFGPNGSGKSTLFSLLSFINKQTKGKLLFTGIDNKSLQQELKKSVVMVPQNPYLLKRTVFENISYGLKLRGETNNLEEKVKEALTLVGLEYSFSKRKWSQLSGGEAQRVALAARLILKPKVLILDEPTTGVDTNSAQLIKEAILSTKQKFNTTILISSHDHNWLNHICDRKVALFNGHLVDSGNLNLLFSPWQKTEDGNLIKFFPDGQQLIIKNSKAKKRDSVVMIDSDAISICRLECNDLICEDTLMGVINSISQQASDDTLLVEFTIGGISFNCKIDRQTMQEQRFLPSDRVYVNIDTNKVCWM